MVVAEDFPLYPENTDTELVMPCPVPGCDWKLNREIARMWFLLREAQQHLTEEHES